MTAPMVGSRLGPYELIGLLGTGGMGEVYRARDPRLDRFVAVKVLRGGEAGNADARRRFEQEARAVAALNHPNILALFDIGEEDGTAFVVTELLEGQTLRARLEAGRLPEGEILRFATAVAQGLAAAHARGVLHRDLKPENLFLTQEGVAKILDFGLARVNPPGGPEGPTLSPHRWRQTASGIVLGTACYMSPEQARGELLDARSDLFSFGCVLYEMLSGRKAFGRPSPVESMAAILHEDPSPLAGSRSPVEIELERTILPRCLAKCRDDRFPSAVELIEALKGIRAGSRPMKGGHHPWRGMALIHPGRWLTAAAVLAVLGGGWLFVHPLRSGPHRLAVLPLRNGTGDPTLDSVAEGLTSELINNLSRSLSRGGKVHVLSRTTTRPYAQAGKSLPQIARELDADEVVEWDLFRSEGRFRIAINLFGKDDQPIWSSELSEAESNLFALQALLTRTLAARLDPEPQVGQALSVLPADAHRAYLRGLYWLDFPKEDVTSVDKAISAFQEAVHLAPDFAEGWSTLAAALSFRGLFTDGGRVADITHARAAAERALHLDPNLPEAQIAMGGHQLWSEWNWREAESSIRKGLASSPNSVSGHEALGWFYMTQGRVDEALQEGRIACKLDPLSLRWRASLAVLLIFAHRYEEAQAEAEEGLRMEPDSERLHNFAGWAAMERKRYGEWLPHEQALKGNPPHWMEDLREAVRKGEREVLELALARYRKEGDDFSTAQTLSRLGRNEEALDLLDSLYGHHPPVMTLILTDPSFLGLHGHPRFKAILRRMELPGG